MSFRETPETDVAVFMADGSIALDVRVQAESVWLTQKQMALLFNTSTDNIGLHLSNIYRDEELAENATTEDCSVVRVEGHRQIKRTLKHYNLDAILSVGYRINSKRGTQFRIWANTVLRDHLLKGYSLNTTRLQSQNIEDLQSAIALLTSTLSSQAMVTDQGHSRRHP